MNHTNIALLQPFSPSFSQLSALQSPTLQIGLDCINNSDSAEDAIRKFPIHSGEIALAAMALLFTNDDQDAAQDEIFEYVSNLICVHDELY